MLRVCLFLICIFVFVWALNGFFCDPRILVNFPEEEEALNPADSNSDSGKMASQVETSPFGCVLKDHNYHNRRQQPQEKCRDRESSALQKSLKELIRDYDYPTHNENSFHQHFGNPNLKCWISEEQKHKDRFASQIATDSTHIHTHKVANNEEDSMPTSPIQSRILERWAARQAHEIVTTTERQTHEAELMALSNAQPVSTRASTLRKNSLTTQSGVRNVGTSSLVQMWKDFEAEAKLNRSSSMNSNNSSTSNNSKNNSHPESTSFCDEPPKNSSSNDDAFKDWELDRMVPADSVSSSQDNDAAESERLRVADIIRRWTNGSYPSWSDDNDNVNSPKAETMDRLGGSNTIQVQAVSSPRIRGRQAFKDLLMQMQQDRQRELDQLVDRHAVSRFSHRGRIQSCLRLRFLHHRTINQAPPHPRPTPSKSETGFQGSNIMLLRERFSTAAGNDVLKTSQSPREGTAIDTLNSESTSISSLPNEENRHQEIKTSGKQNTPVKPLPRAHQVQVDEEANAISKVMQKQRSCDAHKVASQDTENMIEALYDRKQRMIAAAFAATEDINEDNTAEEEEEEEEDYDDDDDDEEKEEEEDDDDDDEEGEDDDIAAATAAAAAADDDDDDDGEVREEEGDIEDAYDQPCTRNNLDWLNDISRPREYWANLRQEWYQEVLDTNSDNDEIRQLLQRRSVSNMLASNFKEKMDKLIMSSVQRQIYPDQGGNWTMEIQEGEEEEEEEYRDEAVDIEEEEEQVEQEEEDDDDDDGQRPHISQYHEVGDDSSPTESASQQNSPSQLSIWSLYQDDDNHCGHHSAQVASTSMEPPSPAAQSCYQDAQQFSFLTNHSSVEMQLIHDMRGHIEQLHQEMTELRKTVKTMQAKLQNTIKQEVQEAVRHSVRGKGEDSAKRVPTRKGKCCICCEMKVDSLLYRCGHMCTCFNCAHELQWSSGKCPICRAPILDIVRAYTDS